MSVYVNMAMPMFGSNSLSFSTTCPSLQSLKVKSSASMVVSHPVSTLWIRSASLIAFKRHPTRAQSAISYGLIPMTDVVGVSPLAVLVTASVKTFLSSSITRTTWHVLPAHISWSWMDTTGHTSVTLSLSSPLPITVTVAATRLQSWRLMSSWSITCK